MALAPTDETDLLLPLHGGVFEQPLWATFLRRLLARTGADRLLLAVRTREMGERSPHVLDAGRSDLPHPAIEELAALHLFPFAALRPGRVYALEEMRALDTDGAGAGAQQAALDRMQIGHARFIRIRTPDANEAWLLLVHSRSEFAAADAALLTALAPHLATALDARARIDALQWRAAMAEETLALLGIEQAGLDAEGHVLAPTPGWTAGERAPDIAAACAAMAGAAPGARRPVGNLLLRPAAAEATALPCPSLAIGTMRRQRQADPDCAAAVLASHFGLSRREAALADAISRGQSIVEAGRNLGLTEETARNYSKRIYAKTGAKGQADLVRLVLTSLAPLA